MRGSEGGAEATEATFAGSDKPFAATCGTSSGRSAGMLFVCSDARAISIRCGGGRAPALWRANFGNSAMRGMSHSGDAGDMGVAALACTNACCCCLQQNCFAAARERLLLLLQDSLAHSTSSSAGSNPCPYRSDDSATSEVHQCLHCLFLTNI